LYLLSSISVATRTIMPIDGIFLIKVDCGSEICNGLIILEEAVPDETTAVVRRRVLWIQFNDFVEVFEGLFEAVAANFLPHRAQMVNCLHIIWLQMDGLEVVLLRFGQMICFIPAKRPIIIRLEVILI